MTMIILILPFIFGIGIFCTALLQIELDLAALESHKASWLRQSEEAFNQALTMSAETTEMLRYVSPTITVNIPPAQGSIISDSPAIVVSIKRSE
jgi:hypothetical protein